MFKDPSNNNKLSIKKGATAKLIKTHDEKFRVVVFTGNDGYLGKGAQGKCYLGILKNQQKCLRQQQFSQIQQFDADQVKQMLSHPSRYPVVVVKEILRDQKKPHQQEMYRKQIQNLYLATQLQGDNSNLVKCYPYILASERHFYMVMEYCNGKSLDLLLNRRLRSNSWFNFFQFLKIFTDIVNGYYPLNKVMIMHQDLKPQNIFIKGKNFKIGDFGLSFLIKSEKGFNRGGTQSYNGIEKYQKGNQNPSHKSDLYSLGVILFKIFYGCHPYYEKWQLQEYKMKELQKIAKQRQQQNGKVKITKWEQIELFVKFYQMKQFKCKKAFIDRPNSISGLSQKYNELVQNLYLEEVPSLIKRLVDKDIKARPSFTEVKIFVKENKIEQIVKEYQRNCRMDGNINMCFFKDLEQQECNQILLSMKFTDLGNKVFFENESEVSKLKAQVPYGLLRTLSANMQNKINLVNKYPGIFSFKQIIEKFNQLTRRLMQIYQELNIMDLKQVLRALNKKTINDQKDQSDFQIQQDNELTFYDDKKMEVEFVVHKYLLSFLSYVLQKAQQKIKELNQAELQIFYKENIDLSLQIMQKNKGFLESQLFLGYNDYADLPQSQREFQRVIVNQFLNEIILEKKNLIFIYYCVAIIRIKENLTQTKDNFISKSEYKKPKYKESVTNYINSSVQDQISLEKNNIFQFFRDSFNQIADPFLKQFEQIIVKQLQKRNITYSVSFN